MIETFGLTKRHRAVTAVIDGRPLREHPAGRAEAMSARGFAATTAPPGPPAAFTSERRELRALRSTSIGIALILLLSVGVGVFMTVIGDGAAVAGAQAENEYAVIFCSSGLTTWAFTYLAASFSPPGSAGSVRRRSSRQPVVAAFWRSSSC